MAFQRGGGILSGRKNAAARGSSSSRPSNNLNHDRSAVLVVDLSALENVYEDSSDDGRISSQPLLKPNNDDKDRDGDGDDSDTWNYILLLIFYILQGIPMGLSASIPFLIQQKVRTMTEVVAAHHHQSSSGSAKMAYNAQAIFALCSWPFSLKLLWAPVVDAIYWKKFGRRKSWLVPAQAMAGLLMVSCSGYVEEQLGLQQGAPKAVAATGVVSRDLNSAVVEQEEHFDVKGVTAFFFLLYFLMATQDIAVDAWALTLLSKKNRGKGPVCNNIGQNIGIFLSYAGFLAFNDADSCENLWRPLFGLQSRPGTGIVTLGAFIWFCGVFMLIVTLFVAIFKREALPAILVENGMMNSFQRKSNELFDEESELDAAELGLHETYRRLWAVCQLPAVRWLFLILVTYRLPTALSDYVKLLKAVEFGLSKQTTALLSPTLILPLGILVPIVASRVGIWRGNPLRQFMDAYKVRVTIAALFDVFMLHAIRSLRHNTDASSKMVFWVAIVGSTAIQAIVHSLMFNAQMTFFAHRVDPKIGGSYMTLLNTAANLGGTWPASVVMYLVGQLTIPPDCAVSADTGGKEICTGRDAYFPLQLAFSILGILWIYFLGNRVSYLAALPDDAWRTHLDEEGVEVEKWMTRKRRR